MYRVFLIPTQQMPRKEEWFEADAVRESRSGDLWEFVKTDGYVVAQLEKTKVRTFRVAADRRKAPRSGASTVGFDYQWDRESASAYPGPAT